MEFLAYLLFACSITTVIAGANKASKESAKYLNRPTDLHFARKAILETYCAIGAVLFIGGCLAYFSK